MPPLRPEGDPAGREQLIILGFADRVAQRYPHADSRNKFRQKHQRSLGEWRIVRQTPRLSHFRASRQSAGYRMQIRFRQSCRVGQIAWCGGRRHLWIGPVSRVLTSPETHTTRERDLAVTAEAIMTKTAATTIAMIQRTQSMPGLPLPPKAV